MALHYNNLRYERGKLVYDSRNTEFTWGGRIAENVVQALSRIIVTDAMLRIQNDPTLDAQVVLTVHDEIVIISQANNPDATMDKLIAHMCTPPDWALDIPLDAEGGYDVSYSKWFMPRLVLTRKLTEKVVIHDDDGVLARVTVSKVDRNQVRLTFEADNEIRIDRQEVFDKNANPTK